MAAEYYSNSMQKHYGARAGVAPHVHTGDPRGLLISRMGLGGRGIHDPRRRAQPCFLQQILTNIGAHPGRQFLCRLILLYEDLYDCHRIFFSIYLVPGCQHSASGVCLTIAPGSFFFLSFVPFPLSSLSRLSAPIVLLR